jgi:hypothetical protein
MLKPLCKDQIVPAPVIDAIFLILFEAPLLLIGGFVGLLVGSFVSGFMYSFQHIWNKFNEE